MGYFAGLYTTPVFGKKKSLLAGSPVSQKMYVYVGVALGMRREAERSLLPISGALVSLWYGDCEGTVVSFFLPQHLKT